MPLAEISSCLEERDLRRACSQKQLPGSPRKDSAFAEIKTAAERLRAHCTDIPGRPHPRERRVKREADPGRPLTKIKTEFSSDPFP